MFTSPSSSSTSSSSFFLYLSFHLLLLLFIPVSSTPNLTTPVYSLPNHTSTTLVSSLPPSTTPVPTTPLSATSVNQTTAQYVKDKEEGGERGGGGGGGGGGGPPPPPPPSQLINGKKGMKVVKHFYLWTRRNSGNASSQLLDPSRQASISNSFFRPHKTFIIIHGFLGWGTEPWILHFKDKLLRELPSNVISVDWPAGTEWWLPSYYTAVGRVPGVAKDLTALLSALATIWDLDYRDVHLIGHSLGAHVAGLAAAPLDKVGRISGLDPAGLTYHKVPASQRLDPSDADYVDVIHTNGCATFNKWLDCYGINENLGHSDFWPNGGEHQPSCVKRRRRRSTATNGEIGCSHEMAYVYYIESLNYRVSETYFLARQCSNYDKYKAGLCSCGSEAQYMGFLVNVRLRGTFYLTTNASPPYAVQDAACPPGTATGAGARLIKLVLITASALIMLGAAISAVSVRVVKRTRRRRSEGCAKEDGGDGGSVAGCSGSGGGSCGDDAVVVVDDEKVLVE